jgi:hypothetical protein
MPLRPGHLLIAAVLGLAGCAPAASAGAPATTPEWSAPPSAERSPASPSRITYPAHGHRKWSVAPAQSGPADGHAGRLMTYRVAVERDINGLAAAAFADTVRSTLADPRGWTAGGDWRFRRAGPGQPYDFTVYLATPDTKDSLCAGSPDGYTSCRNGNSVILNVARWVKGVPHYGASLAAYRQYMVSHEVGHRLGHGHELCTGPGEPAPVMEQQTLGMHGCRPNSWPYRDGRLHAGRSGQYGDPVPGPDKGNQ